MAFFQSSVQEKYLKALNTEQTHAAYIRFKTHFHNPEVQLNIRASKEEQYQEGFLRDLFVGVLGYTLNPTAGFNLTTEYKNVKDSKKADGAIVVDKSVRAVIELKGTDTTDLDKIEPQAFGYKNNQPECTYIIISNFEKLRFYIDNAIDHLEFNLFTLTEKDFELLWLCLAYENIATDLPKKIKTASVSEEDTITKNLYKDYSLFKRELYQNLVALNPDIDELLLFKKSQKLLDRFLFLLFAEDRQLLPPNSVRSILDQWNKLKDMDAYFPLYSRFKTYFGYLNIGHKGKLYDVFAYNGGLFKPDDMLDAVEIDDDLLYRHTLKLSDYDFASEVDVNILGHIFENSLNELDEIKAQLSGATVDKTKTKRKKDGVFYTPKYITKYIVDNTVGKLCAEKQAELGLKEEDYTTDKKQNKNTKKYLYEKLTAYRDWLLQITICDPACGSGAFLNQALDFLINEHRYIDELQAKLFGDTLVLSDVEKSILENNLFGVDINEESVEIAKLSLWLRTAQPNRKLNDLSNNIKCGNSLIDDPAVAGEKAFNWEKEFPQVFGPKAQKDEVLITHKEETPDYLKLIKEKTLEAQQKAEQGIALSKEALEITKQLTEYAEKLASVSAPKADYKKIKKGFDVVIGNPPYVNIANILNNNERDFYQKYYETVKNKSDLYSIFIEKGYHILKKDGKLGFIFPNSWLGTESFTQLRKFLIEKTTINELVKLPGNVFVDAVVMPLIMIFTKTFPLNNTEIILKEYVDGEFIILNNKLDYSRISNSATKTFSFLPDIKINNKAFVLGDIAEFSLGIKTSDDNRFILANKIDDDCYPILRGRNISRYYYTNTTEWIWYKPELINQKVGGRPRVLQNFLGEKIYIQDIAKRIIACYCNKEILSNDTLNLIYKVNEKYHIKTILALLNSSFVNSWFEANFQEGLHIKINQLQQIPIPLINMPEQIYLVEKVDKMTFLNKELNETSQKFQRMLQRKFELEDLPGKLQNWYTLTYKEFIAELSKKRIKLSLAQEAEWEDYFTAEQAKAIEIKNQIDATDREIDRMVYELYGLTEEEVKIVEGEPN